MSDDFEYEIIRPKEPIRIERRGSMNFYIDADGHCFAQHHAEFDEELLRQRTEKSIKIDGKEYLPAPGPLWTKSSVWIKWKVKMAIRKALRKLCESDSR